MNPSFAEETEMFLVEAVWAMPSVANCHTLSKTIREAITNISDGRPIRYIFAANFNRTKPKKKTINSSKNLLKVFHDYSQFFNAKTRMKNIKFRKEKLTLWNWQKNLNLFDQFRQQKTRCRSKQCPYAFRQFFLQIERSRLLPLSKILYTYFQRKLPFSWRKTNGWSSILTSNAICVASTKNCDELVWCCKHYDHLCIQTYALEIEKQFFFTTKKTHGQTIYQYSSMRFLR